MLKFDDGIFAHGGDWWPSYDPGWTDREKNVVKLHCTTIRSRLALIISEVKNEQTKTNALPANTPWKGPWLASLKSFLKILTSMSADLNPTGGKTITFRKHNELEDGIFAQSEDSIRGNPLYVITLNVNPGAKTRFFQRHRADRQGNLVPVSRPVDGFQGPLLDNRRFKAYRAAQASFKSNQLDTLFHELTHIYGTEDKNVPTLMNAHKIDDVIGGGAKKDVAAATQSLLSKARSAVQTKFGPKLKRAADLITMYGKNDVWNTVQFYKVFTIDAKATKDAGEHKDVAYVIRKSDKAKGFVRILVDPNKQKFYYRFKKSLFQ